MRQNVWLPPELAARVEEEVARWERQEGVARLWQGDATLWTGSGEEAWLGWLRATEDRAERSAAMGRLASEIESEELTDAVVLGMGGSSLCPEVLSRTFGRQPGHPRLHVLDSTQPAQIAALERRLQLASTLFVVSSKSGTTLETALLADYFAHRVKEECGEEALERQFVAVTDPGSRLERLGEGEKTRGRYRAVFLGEPEIGGRFSALSPFGMVPAAIQGLDVARLLQRAHGMAEACGPGVSAVENPGLRLGVVLGVLGREAIDKITLVASPGVESLGAWLEQLVAESTGKRGVALIPVDGEQIAAPDEYGDDRLFVYLRLATAPDRAQDEAVERLRRAGRPVVRIELDEPYDLAAEFFRWEFATAVTGAVLGINPFDQPDVEASKAATREIMGVVESTGALPDEQPFLEESGLRLYVDERNAREIAARRGDAGGVAAALEAHLGRLGPGDYLALLGWIEMSPEHDRELRTIRHQIRRRHGVATCVGYGPRYLHSTGQAHKGGPNRGVFLQITGESVPDVEIPGREYTFGTTAAAQARGDLAVLAERGRRALRVHLGGDTTAGLRALTELVAALGG